MTGWARFSEGKWTLQVYVQPGARKNEIMGEHDGRLKIRISAPPADGRANQALIEFIAQIAGLPTGKVKLVRGQTGRMKTLLVESEQEQWVAGILAWRFVDS